MGRVGCAIKRVRHDETSRAIRQARYTLAGYVFEDGGRSIVICNEYLSLQALQDWQMYPAILPIVLHRRCSGRPEFQPNAPAGYKLAACRSGP